MINVFSVSYSFRKGGAAIAARKFAELLVGENIRMSHISQDDAGYWSFFKRVISYVLVRLQFDSNPVKHSLNLFSHPPVLKCFLSDADVYHLHWINNDTLSVFDFDKIPVNTIFTLHDEWLYCGAEHYYDVYAELGIERSDFDFVEGYQKKISSIRGVNWSYFIWQVKLTALQNRKDIIYTVPSTWMLDRAKKSKVLRGADIRLLPNPIDCEVFKPLSSVARKAYRLKLGFAEDDFVIVFGAINGSKNPAKGASQLVQALNFFNKLLSEKDRKTVRLVAFGDTQSLNESFSSFPCMRVGHISDPEELSALYSSSDCMALPSLVESFGQVAAESLASATPIVCFDTSGLKDIVIHEHSGFVVEPFDTDAFGCAINEIFLLSADQRASLGRAGRNFVLNEFSYLVVRHKYLELLEEVARKS